MAARDRSQEPLATHRRPIRPRRDDGDLGLAVRGAPVALVVDDQPFVRRFLSTVLRRQGWSVREASDAASAMAVADAEPLDLLVTDYEMPLVTGVALARALRRRHLGLPVLMVSGNPDAALAIAGLQGPTAFARKPITVEELVARIGSIVH